MTTSLITPGFLALHSHRSEVLAETLSAWLTRQALAPLELEVVLVQSNGMAEWIKMALAGQGATGGGVCAATQVELPSRFLWRTYRQVLGAHNVPADSPLDKLPMTWRLMALLPSCVDDPVFQPVAGFLRGQSTASEPDNATGDPTGDATGDAAGDATGDAAAGSPVNLGADETGRGSVNLADPEMGHQMGPETGFETSAKSGSESRTENRSNCVHQNGNAATLEPDRLLQLASRLADLFDQYQIYRPDWLQDWAEGRNVLRRQAAQPVLPSDEAGQLPQDQLWQAELWRRVLATLTAAQQQATRPALHLRALARLQSGEALASPVARRVSVFGMSHMPSQLLEMLAALATHSQVLLAVPNPCQHHWGDIMDGRDALRAQRRRHGYKDGVNLSVIPFEQMHLHAPALLAAWGRQGRDFVRQLDAFDDLQAAQERAPGVRLDLFDDAPEADASGLLAQLQNRIRDLRSAQEPVDSPWRCGDDSIVFKVAHSPVRELEVLHDQLLSWFHAQPETSPRDVVVMVPDIEVMAPAIRAVFGQYKRGDARFIPFDVADLGAQATSPLIQAVAWLLALPQQRGRMSELVTLLEVPALAARFGLTPAQLPTLTRWMAGSGIRWGLSASHRAGLGLAACGDDNAALWGVQRMLMGYACGADPVPDSAGIAPYAEVGGLDAELAGALAHLLQALLDWWAQCASPATPQQWAERCRAMLASLFKAQAGSDVGGERHAERNALSALDQALNDWIRAADQADFADAVPLAVARSAWLEALKMPKLDQGFRAGGVTFCTLMPMRTIPFQRVCLLGMNDGDYPRRSPRADFDLLGSPGMGRPGDRSRRDDDRQLMLEALLSARRTLYVSWSGRSVRNNSEQPPSVLVSQLRDEIDALWGAGTAQRLTTVHPLQPFSRAYFEENNPLHTYAKEWRAAQKEVDRTIPRDDNLTGDHGLTGRLPPLESAQGTPVITLAQLGRFLRQPVGAFFRERLQVHLDDERSAMHDEELFGLGGLDLYQLLDQPLQHAPTDLSPEGLPAHTQGVVHRLRLAGALPLAGVGQLEARELSARLQAMLGAALQERAALVLAAPRVLIDLAHPHVLLQDALSGIWVGALNADKAQQTRRDKADLHTNAPNGDAWETSENPPSAQTPAKSTGEPTDGAVNGVVNGAVNGAVNGTINGPVNESVNGPENGPENGSANGAENGPTKESTDAGCAMLLSLRANALADLKGKTPKALPDKLIDIWLVSLAAAAMGRPLQCVVVGANAVLRTPPLAADAARAQFQVLLSTWAEGMRWPLPLPPAMALQWLKDSDNLNALHDLYEGSNHQRAERSKDPALARTYATLDEIMASGDFERLAQAVYAPLRDWAACIQIEALSDAPAQHEPEDLP